jgi:hypothetical protein
MAQMSRQEVCAGARDWFQRHGRPADPDAIRVFEGICEHGDATLEDVVAGTAGSDDPLTPERAEAAWGRLEEIADKLRQGYL